MLETRFPRLPGDVGHPATWRSDSEYLVVTGAGPRDAVRDAEGLRTGPVPAAFIAAALRLQSEGAGAITTSCGFLVLLQGELAAALRVPIVTSSLLQLPDLLSGQRQVGLLTIDANSLGTDHLAAAGVPASRLADVVVQGMDANCEFVRAILGNREVMDEVEARRDVVDAALQLQRRAPSLSAVVLECTNMLPHAASIAEATGWPVRGLTDDPVLKPYTARIHQEIP